MKRYLLLASIGLALSSAARAGDGGPVIHLPGIEIRPHPAPTAPDYGTCLMKCAVRQDACLHGERRRLGPRECRLQRSLCDSDCIRYRPPSGRERSPSDAENRLDLRLGHRGHDGRRRG